MAGLRLPAISDYPKPERIASPHQVFFVASLATPKPNPVSYLDQARAKTNYAPRRFTGYVPLPLAASAEMRRLASGFAGLALLQVIAEQSLGRRVKETEPFCETTGDLSTAELVDAARCDERTVQREL